MTKLQELYNAYEKYLTRQPDSSLYYAEAMIQLADLEEEDELHAFGLNLQGVAQMHLHRYDESAMSFGQAQERYEQLEPILKIIKPYPTVRRVKLRMH